MKTIPLKVFSHYSTLDAFGKIDEYVARAAELNMPALALTDIHTVSGAVEFLQEIEKINKGREQKIKPLLGCTLRIYDVDNDRFGYSTVICRNKDGWYNLLKILGTSKFHKGQLAISEWNEQLYKNLICLGPILPNPIVGLEGFTPPKQSVYYCNKEDKLYQQIIVCSKQGCTIKQWEQIPDEDCKKFFGNENFHLDWIESDSDSIGFANQIEPFSLSSQPHIPDSEFADPNKTLVELCRQGWKDRNINDKLTTPELKEVYVDRIKEELEVITGANLSNYMLIVREFTHFAKKNNASIGLRGSAVGCMVSYLLGISDMDPIQPDPTLPYAQERELLFTRFINKGRLSTGSLPDIDCDMPISFREKLIQFTKDKWGKDQVSNIITFNRMDGKAAIKEVFKIMDPTDNAFEISGQITKFMVDTAKVQDVLEELKEDNPKYNVIQYCIDNIPKIKEYYDEYRDIFDIAIKMAGTIKSHGKHAAGIVITSKPMWELFPVTFDGESGQMILALEMAEAEYCGAVKYDFLGVAAYEKIDQIQLMINNELVEPILDQEGSIYAIK